MFGRGGEEEGEGGRDERTLVLKTKHNILLISGSITKDVYV